jgi:hypothetical protein
MVTMPEIDLMALGVSLSGPPKAGWENGIHVLKSLPCLRFLLLNLPYEIVPVPLHA